MGAITGPILGAIAGTGRRLPAAALVAAALVAASWAGAAAAQERTYACETGDLGYAVDRAVGTGTFIDPQFVIVTFDGSEIVAPEDRTPPFVLPQVSPGLYEGPEGRFSLFDLTLTLVPEDTTLACVGISRGADGGPAPDARSGPYAAFGDAGFGPNSVADPGAREATVMGVPGMSRGGSLRAGPGLDAARVGSLADGTPVTIVANSGRWMDGYYWFEIIAPDAEGGETSFQWGGIMCVRGDAVAGAFPCEDD